MSRFLLLMVPEIPPSSRASSLVLRPASVVLTHSGHASNGAGTWVTDGVSSEGFASLVHRPQYEATRADISYAVLHTLLEQGAVQLMFTAGDSGEVELRQRVEASVVDVALKIDRIHPENAPIRKAKRRSDRHATRAPAEGTITTLADLLAALGDGTSLVIKKR